MDTNILNAIDFVKKRKRHPCLDKMIGSKFLKILDEYLELLIVHYYFLDNSLTMAVSVYNTKIYKCNIEYNKDYEFLADLFNFTNYFQTSKLRLYFNFSYIKSVSKANKIVEYMNKYLDIKDINELGITCSKNYNVVFSIIPKFSENLLRNIKNFYLKIDDNRELTIEWLRSLIDKLVLVKVLKLVIYLHRFNLNIIDYIRKNTKIIILMTEYINDSTIIDSIATRFYAYKYLPDSYTIFHTEFEKKFYFFSRKIETINLKNLEFHVKYYNGEYVDFDILSDILIKTNSNLLYFNIYLCDCIITINISEKLNTILNYSTSINHTEYYISYLRYLIIWLNNILNTKCILNFIFSNSTMILDIYNILNLYFYPRFIDEIGIECYNEIISQVLNENIPQCFILDNFKLTIHNPFNEPILLDNIKSLLLKLKNIKVLKLNFDIYNIDIITFITNYTNIKSIVFNQIYNDGNKNIELNDTIINIFQPKTIQLYTGYLNSSKSPILLTR
jgi:hypothetical protein